MKPWDEIQDDWAGSNGIREVKRKREVRDAAADGTAEGLYAAAVLDAVAQIPLIELERVEKALDVALRNGAMQTKGDEQSCKTLIFAIRVACRQIGINDPPSILRLEDALDREAWPPAFGGI